MLAAVGPDSAPLVVAWVAAAIGVVLGGRLVHRRGRTIGAAALCVLCVLLTWEGGLFFLPAAASLLLAETLSARTTPPATGA